MASRRRHRARQWQQSRWRREVGRGSAPWRSETEREECKIAACVGKLCSFVWIQRQLVSLLPARLGDERTWPRLEQNLLPHHANHLRRGKEAHAACGTPLIIACHISAHTAAAAATPTCCHTLYCVLSWPSSLLPLPLPATRSSTANGFFSSMRLPSSWWYPMVRSTEP